MTPNPDAPWRSLAVLAGRLIFAAVFLLAVSFKFADIGGTATYIGAEGFPVPQLLAWCAAVLEVLLIVGFVTGIMFTETCLIAALYILFLGIVFHGPDKWQGNQVEFGFFVDHFSFIAGLLIAAAHGPGRWAWRPRSA